MRVPYFVPADNHVPAGGGSFVANQVVPLFAGGEAVFNIGEPFRPYPHIRGSSSSSGTSWLTPLSALACPKVKRTLPV